MRKLLIVTAGGLARETAELATRSPEWDLIGFIDDEPLRHGTEIANLPVLGGIEYAAGLPDTLLVVCAGKGQTRRIIVQRLAELGVTDHRYATVIAPDVVVPPSCSVGVGSILLSGTVLTTDIVIGQHVVAMPGVVLTHDDRVADYGTLCARVSLGGNVTVGEAAYLGMGSLVRQQLRVGAESVLGMGAVLLQDLPPGQTWIGVPAHPLPQPSTGPDTLAAHPSALPVVSVTNRQ